jgi:hypothetical protein
MVQGLTITSINVESIRKYLKEKFPNKTISEAKRFAFYDDEISFGFLIKMENVDGVHSVLFMNEILENISANEIHQIFGNNDFENILRKAGKKIVRVKLSGFDFCDPLLPEL